MGTVNPKLTPAKATPLLKDADGALASGAFSYSSVVGMLLYLSGHTRFDIAYAVNCTVLYIFNPKKSLDETSEKRIVRYLKATRDMGLIINLSSNILKIDSYPDADFVGMYWYKRPDDLPCMKSRTGYIINVADCLVQWQSKLQTETALSTMKAKVVAMVHYAWELIPIIQMVEFLGPAVGLAIEATCMYVSIHKDNAGL